MKRLIRLLALTLLTGNFIAPVTSLEAYGYQPDSGGYAYAESCYSVDASPLMPVTALAAAVVIGVILYSGHHHHHSSSHSH